jgi:hypothetical protein
VHCPEGCNDILCQFGDRGLLKNTGCPEDAAEGQLSVHLAPLPLLLRVAASVWAGRPWVTGQACHLPRLDFHPPRQGVVHLAQCAPSVPPFGGRYRGSSVQGAAWKLQHFVKCVLRCLLIPLLTAAMAIKWDAVAHPRASRAWKDTVWLIGTDGAT